MYQLCWLVVMPVVVVVVVDVAVVVVTLIVVVIFVLLFALPLLYEDVIMIFVMSLVVVLGLL